MKYIKTQELFNFFKKDKITETPSEKHLKVVKQFLRNNKYKVNDNMTVDVIDDFSCGIYNHNKVRDLPIKFNIAHGNFSVAYQDLLSLRLCPVEVKGNFDCSANNLANLKDAPIRVGGNFRVESKGHLQSSKLCLKTLEGCSKFIGGDLDIRGNGIYSFDYFPVSLGGDFLCKGNPIFYIWNLFLDKGKIDVFNDYDPIKPPINGDAYLSYDNKPRLYLDVLELFLDNENAGAKVSFKDTHAECIIMYYNVLGMDNSRKKVKDVIELLEKYN